MSNSFFMPFWRSILILIIIVFAICTLFIPAIYYDNPNFSSDYGFSFLIDGTEYVWPTPGYTYITSYFGRRDSPTSGATSYHKGLDIGAPEGSNLIAVTSGEITFTGFLGGGGYTITLTSGSIKFTYCHVSPTYIVKEGDFVTKGQIIRICWSQKRLWCKRKSIYR